MCQEKNIKICTSCKNDNKQSKKDFSIIGLGSVGWAVVHGLHSKGFSYTGYDVVGSHDWSQVLESKIAFICSSTPSGSDGRLDCSSVEDILNKLYTAHYPGVIAIKSTVSVGFMDKAVETHPNLRLVYMPEFLRERSCYSWFLNPDRLVISGRQEDIKEVLTLFTWVPDKKIIKTSHIGAEIGKLTHNSYIATKVSFTNEMERICKENDADPHEVMEIVWRDRRVNCSDHLTPGLGPFGGKCVVKDMNELMVVSDSPLLKAVRQVNGMTKASETKPIYSEVNILIPTYHQPNFLKRALSSIAQQTYQPKSVNIVADPSSPYHLQIQEICEEFSSNLLIRILINSNTESESGAINTGLSHISSICDPKQKGFIALLDDDDWWDCRYLENCVKFCYETDADWVISGLIRHDEINPKGSLQNIPSSLKMSDFLVGNPNIQNSNLFINIEALNAVDGYDEDLVSTTDRDICLRLLNNGTHYEVLFNHLVHHDAFCRSDRLSHPGSPRKRDSLKKFYQKYRDIMTKEERIAFKERAKNLFLIEIQED